MGELIFEVIFVAIGVALAFATYAIVAAVRRLIHALDRLDVVRDPEGNGWKVYVTPQPVLPRWSPSRWFFRMRPEQIRRRRDKGERDPTKVGDDDAIVVPLRWLEKLDEAGLIIVPVLFVVVVLFVAVLAAEFVVVTVAAALTILARSLFGDWRCEVVAPDGTTTVTRWRRFRSARRDEARARDEIMRGVFARREMPGPPG